METNPLLRVILCCCFTLVVSSNLIGNTVCFIILLRMRNLKMATKVFMMSMTSVDLCMIVNELSMLWSMVTKYWPLGDHYCIFSGILNETLLTTGALSLFAVNVDRYIAIMKPLHFDLIMTRYRVVFSIISIWTVGVFSGLFLAFGPNRSVSYHPEFHLCFTVDTSASFFKFSSNSTSFSNVRSCKSDIVRTVWSAVISIPIVLTMLMFLRIFCVAKQHARQINAGLPAQMRHNDSNMKAFQACFLMTACLTVTTFPMISLVLYIHLDSTETCPPEALTFVCLICLYSYSTLNVLIYYKKNKDFSEEARRLGERIVQLFSKTCMSQS